MKIKSLTAKSLIFLLLINLISTLSGCSTHNGNKETPLSSTNSSAQNENVSESSENTLKSDESDTSSESAAELNSQINSVAIDPAIALEKSNQAYSSVIGELSEAENDMISKALLGSGNNYRLKKVIEKARSGERVMLGFIGGSITYGYNSGTPKIFSKLVTDFFSQSFGTGSNVFCINVGISGTPSSLGLIRSDRDLFKYKPDIIFIEFAVNDSTDNNAQIAYENLIRKSLSQPNEPAVILLMSVLQSGYTAQDNMNLIGYNYDLTRISVKNAIWNSLEDNSISWSDWAKDDAHPNAWGHKMYAAFIIDYLMAVDAQEIDEEYQLRTDFVKNKDFTKLIMTDSVDNTEAIDIISLGSFASGSTENSFKNGWHAVAEETSSDLTFTFTGKALYIVYKDTANKNYCSAEVTVDGVKKATLDGYSSDGWNNPDTVLIFSEKESASHTVTITPKDSNKEFEILCFGIVP